MFSHITNPSITRKELYHLYVSRGSVSLLGGYSAPQINGESINGESINGESINGESINGGGLDGLDLPPDVDRVTLR